MQIQRGSTAQRLLGVIGSTWLNLENDRQLLWGKAERGKELVQEPWGATAYRPLLRAWVTWKL